MIDLGLALAEPDVTLTDWALAVEAVTLAALARPAGAAWTAFFASIGVAALLGGIAHGFFPDAGTLAGVVVWRATLLALGVTSVAAVVAGARSLGRRLASLVRTGAVVLAGAYAVVVIAVTDAFAVAVLAYVPATLFLLAVFLAGAWRTGERGMLAGAAGVVILLAGSWIQWRALGVPALGLSHNAAFHVVQMTALPLIYLGARGGSGRC